MMMSCSKYDESQIPVTSGGGGGGGGLNYEPLVQ